MSRPSASAARTSRRLSASALVAVAMLGPLLIGSALYSQRAVRQVSDSVLRGEADGWMRALGSRLHETPGPPTEEVLRSFLEEARRDGLRYVGYVGREQRVEAGRPAGPLGPEALAMEPTWVDGVVRFAAPARMRGMRPPGLRGDLRLAPGEGRPPGPRFEGRPRPMAWLVLEFEPRAWSELRQTSRGTLAVGSVTAAAVMILALWVWRSMKRQIIFERAAERDRHLAALGEMSAVLAHEIRNPLASLKGNAQLLVEGLAPPGPADPGKAQKKAQRVVDEAIRLERITTDLLDFVRQAPFEGKPTDLGALVRASVAEIVPAERLVLRLPAASVVVPADGERLRQVLENLTRNAVQAGEGPVEISVDEAAASVAITVRDHGPGIPAGHEERIFEPFVTTRTRGTGLGLAIARRIAERHGGTLAATNHPDGGALFRLTLPR